MTERQVEWAVVQSVFRGIAVVKGGLGSREEAETWRAALELTRRRENHEHFMKTDGVIVGEPLEIDWRYVDHWHAADEEPNTETKAD